MPLLPGDILLNSKELNAITLLEFYDVLGPRQLKRWPNSFDSLANRSDWCSELKLWFSRMWDKSAEVHEARKRAEAKRLLETYHGDTGSDVFLILGTSRYTYIIAPNEIKGWTNMTLGRNWFQKSWLKRRRSSFILLFQPVIQTWHFLICDLYNLPKIGNIQFFLKS